MFKMDPDHMLVVKVVSDDQPSGECNFFREFGVQLCHSKSRLYQLRENIGIFDYQLIFAQLEFRHG